MTPTTLEREREREVRSVLRILAQAHAVMDRRGYPPARRWQEKVA